MLRGVLYSRGGQRDVEKTFQLFLPQSGGLLSTAHSQDGRSFYYLNNVISVELHYCRKNGQRKSFYYIGFFYYFGFLCCSRQLTMWRRRGILEQCISILKKL